MTVLKVENRSDVIKWDVNYSVGITEIDMQHRMMLLMLNEVNNSVLQGKDYAAMVKIIDGMVSYTRQHIATEEKLFDDYAYPFSATHKTEHQTLNLYLADFSREYQNGTALLTTSRIASLSDWLKNHFISKDKTYSYFFIRKGLN